MKSRDAKSFFDWLWDRLKEEPEIEKALDKMLYIERVKMEREILNKLLEDQGRRRK